VSHKVLIKTRNLVFTLIAVSGVLALGFGALPKSPGTAEGVRTAGATSTKAPPSGAQPLAVQFIELRPETVELSVPASGRLLANESVDVVSELSRRLKRVRVTEGSQVKRGDVLFELETDDLSAQLAQLNVQVRLAKVNNERQITLSAEGLSPTSETLATQAEYDALLAQRQALQVTLAKAIIRAPFAGTVGLRQVSEGAWVSPSTVLVSLQDTTRLKLDFNVGERYAGILGSGKQVRFRVEGRPEVFVAEVTAFEPAVDQNSRSIVVRAMVNNEQGLLPGTFVNVEFPLKSVSALLVPTIVVNPGAQGSAVFVEKAGVAHSVAVELGERQGERVEVVKGLSAGDRVIVSNLLRLRQGTKVVARPVEATP
jgi:membrane fusion protein, multidrug efflux system